MATVTIPSDPVVDPTVVPEGATFEESADGNATATVDTSVVPPAPPDGGTDGATDAGDGDDDGSTDAPVTAEAAVEQAGLDMGKLAEEWNTSGKLSDESYEKLAAKGITKETVDAYVEGQKAVSEKYTQDLATAVGGKETLEGILGWASENLTENQKAIANAALASMDVEQAQLVLDGLKARYVAATGSEPRLVTAEAVSTTGNVKPFESAAQLSEAMRNPKYHSDPAYRTKVEKRLAISNL